MQWEIQQTTIPNKTKPSNVNNNNEWKGVLKTIEIQWPAHSFLCVFGHKQMCVCERERERAGGRKNKKKRVKKKTFY